GKSGVVQPWLIDEVENTVGAQAPDHAGYCVDDLPETLFALSQSRGALQDLPLQRAVPDEQAKKEQERSTGRITGVVEVPSVVIDRTAEPVLVDLLQLVRIDGGETGRHTDSGFLFPLLPLIDEDALQPAVGRPEGERGVI